MITFRQKGDFSNTTNYFKRLKQIRIIKQLEKYGREGVQALSSMTPMDTGLTASSWYYEIKQTDEEVSITFNNSHVKKGVNIALILQLRAWYKKWRMGRRS